MLHRSAVRTSSAAAKLAIAVLVAGAAAPSWGAPDENFTPFTYEPEDPTSLRLDGPLDGRSALAFSKALDELRDLKRIVLSSPGGDVYAALLIAREIDRQGLSTLIPRNAVCFSACSFLYLAGHDRQAQGSLGVHQISSEEPDLAAGQVALSDIVELLTDFSVPNDVVVLMLRTPASDMHIFTAEDMTRYGLVGPRPTTGEDPLQSEDRDFGQDDPTGSDPTEAEAQFDLGRAYSSGNGVPQDYVEAARWLRLAAEQGHAGAQALLGYMYDAGLGVTQNYLEAVKWYRLAAEQGYAGGQFLLAGMYEDGLGVAQDYEEAARWYHSAAEQGYALAQTSLGSMYWDGRGVRWSYEEAAKWYRSAAEKGDGFGQYNLGNMYDQGLGVPLDAAEAARWYRLAAEQGHPQAQAKLGRMYQSGRGVSQDYEEAAKWYRLAAEQGDADGQFGLGLMLWAREGGQEDDAEAVRWYRLAADQGHSLAQATLGLSYSYGDGVRRDPRQAADLLMRALKQSDGYVRSILLDERGADLPDDTRQAIQAWLKERDYYSGAIDGDFGQGTIAALEAYAREVEDQQD